MQVTSSSQVPCWDTLEVCASMLEAGILWTNGKISCFYFNWGRKRKKGVHWRCRNFSLMAGESHISDRCPSWRAAAGRHSTLQAPGSDKLRWNLHPHITPPWEPAASAGDHLWHAAKWLAWLVQWVETQKVSFLSSWHSSLIPPAAWHFTELTTNFNCSFQPQVISWDAAYELFTEFQVLINRRRARTCGWRETGDPYANHSRVNLSLTPEGLRRVSYLTEGEYGAHGEQRVRKHAWTRNPCTSREPYLLLKHRHRKEVLSLES